VAKEVDLIIQVPRGSSIDENLRKEPPAGLADRRILVEHLPVGADGTLEPPPAGDIVLTVPSPEALRREPEQVERAILAEGNEGGPLVVLVDGAEYLRDDELEAVVVAAAQTGRVVILRILEGV
jgi:hypothetical protein